MRKFTKLGALVAAAATTVGLLAVPAAAVDPAHPVIYLGVAGGSKVEALDNTVTSGLTAPSGIEGFTYPNSAQNTIANAQVTNLASTGVINTDESATSVGAGADLVSHARTLGVNLLNGLVTADVVDTTSTADFDGTAFTAGSSTLFTGIKITNVNLPVNIKRNFTVDVPNVARIVLNYSRTYSKNGQIATIGAGVYIQLLGSFGTSPLGTQVFINPTYAALTAHTPQSPVILGGSAYASRVSVNALNIVGINSGRTAFQTLAAGGTGGQVHTNDTAGITIPKVLRTGAVSTTVRGSHTNVSGDALTTAKVAQLNLFAGLIKAKAIKAYAHVNLASDGTLTVTNRVRLVGLVIAGNKIPITVKPNTRIDVAKLGTVTLNQQFGNSFDTNVRAIDIRLSTARAGLPIGAHIELAFASAYVVG